MTPLSCARRLAVLGALLLVACAPQPRRQPIRIVVAAQPACLTLEQALARVGQGASATAGGAEGCVNARLLQLSQRAMAQESRTDLARLQTQLEALTLRPDLTPAQLAWARLLLQQVGERRRLGEALDKQQALSREQQKRADDLAAKLNALREVENELLLKSGRYRSPQP